MPESPERQIEELLRAYAAKRRQEAGPPLELHPVHRRLLLDEAARTWGQQPAPASARRPGWAAIAALWPRLAGAAVVLALIGLGSWAVIRSTGLKDKELRLAAQPTLPGQPTEAARPTLAHPGPNGRPVRAVAEAQRETVAQLEVQAARQVAGRPSADTATTLAAAKAEPSPVPPAAAAADSARSLAAAPAAAPAAPAQAEPEGVRVAAGPDRPQPTTKAGPLALPDRAPLPEPSAAAPTRPSNELGAATAKPLSDALAKAEGQVEPAATESAMALTVPKHRGLTLEQPLPPEGTDQAGRKAPAAAQPAYARPVQAGLAAADRGVILPDGVRLRFVRTETPAAASTRRQVAEASALASFELERRGNQVRLFDQDGSIYEGQLTELPEGLLRMEVKVAAKPEGIEAGAAGARRLERDGPSEFAGSPQPWTVRVAGTNLSLRQPLVFQGSLSRSPAALTADGATATAGAPAQPRGRGTVVGQRALQAGPSQRQAAPSAVGPLRLEGVVQIGTNTFSIQAVAPAGH